LTTKVHLNNISYQQTLKRTNKFSQKTDFAPSFCSKNALPNDKVYKFLDKIEYFVRITSEKTLSNLAWMANLRKNKKSYEEFMKLNENSPEFMQALLKKSNQMAGFGTTEINIESGCIKELANSDESCIFIANHDKHRKYASMLGLFNSILTKEYINAGRAKTCPRPKIVVADLLTKSMNKNFRQIMAKIGIVDVDAKLIDPNKAHNTKKIIPIVKGIAKNRVNLFIVPEGRMFGLGNLAPEYKFQTGIGDIVSCTANLKKRVKIVPIGLYSTKESKSIHIGKPIYFRQENGTLTVSEGNIDSKFTSNDYINFFKNNKSNAEGYTTITDKGFPVDKKNLPEYISGLLCENIKICEQEAQKGLLKPKSDKIVFLDEI